MSEQATIRESSHGGELSLLCSLICSTGSRLHREHALAIRAAGGETWDGSTGRDCTVAARLRYEVRSVAEQLAEQAPGDWPSCLRSNLASWDEQVGRARDDAALARSLKRAGSGISAAIREAASDGE